MSAFRRLAPKHVCVFVPPGKTKPEAEKAFGKENVALWASSYDIAPHPMSTDGLYYPKKDRRFASLCVLVLCGRCLRSRSCSTHDGLLGTWYARKREMFNFIPCCSVGPIRVACRATSCFVVLCFRSCTTMSRRAVRVYHSLRCSISGLPVVPSALNDGVYRAISLMDSLE